MKKSLFAYKLSFIIVCLSISIIGSSQIQGSVYRDYNNNGNREITASYTEPLVPGIIINAYNAADILIASYNSTKGTGYPYTAPNYSIPAGGVAYNGTPGSNTGFVGSGVAVRIEFIIPSSGSCLVNNSIDFSGAGGGSSVQFTNGGGSNINFGINNPADYVSTTNPRIYVAQYANGDPLGGGTSGAYNWFRGFDYNNSGTTAPSQNLNGTTIGSVYGIAYSRQAKKIFTSAFLKRHAGLGILGSGGIYTIDPVTFTASAFYDMDANGYHTRAISGCVTYGNGTSFNIVDGPFVPDMGGVLTHTQTITYMGSIDPVSGAPCGLGVIGTNTDRGLNANKVVHSNDPAAFDQVGKVSLGDMEISDDGRFLFVTNLFDRKIYRLQLNNAYNPTSVIAVTSYSIPAVAVTDGVLRPFGLKFYRDKLFAGAVATGESGGTAANLFGYAFELINPTAAASFNVTPVLQFPLNYFKGINIDGTDESWLAWDNILPTQRYDWDTNDPQPIFSGIEFDDDGSMIIGLRDRAGDQIGHLNHELTGTINRRVITAGDMLRAYYNHFTCTFEIETNGKEGISSPKPSSLGAGNNEGIGGGEFYYEDNIFGNSLNTSMGSLVLLQGMGEVATNIMDPFQIFSAGVSWMNNITGANTRDYELYYESGIASNGKSNGLGDIEMAGEEPPIEIGNRIWFDGNSNGIQDAGEMGMTNISLDIFIDNNNDGNPDGAAIGSTITNANGEWFFNNSNITGDADPNTAGVQPVLTPGIRYIVRIGAADWSGGDGVGDLFHYYLTWTDNPVNGAPDLSDNDAVNHIAGSFSVPQISIVAGKYGENNHTYDFGFTSIPLPLTLLSFTAKLNTNNTVDLKWTTVDESNVSHFVVEKSSDGTNFKSAGTVQAKGNSAAKTDYSFTDILNTSQADFIYYRLRMLDMGGKYKYSEIRIIKPEAKNLSIISYPNPATNKLRITIPITWQNKKVKYELFSANGQAVKRVENNSSGQTETMNIISLSSGMYVLQVSCNGETARQKIIKR